MIDRTNEVKAILAEQAVEDDDQGFYDLEREEVVEALTWYEDDSTDEDVAREILGDLGFDVDAWFNDPQ